jgi:hypothetical protein
MVVNAKVKRKFAPKTSMALTLQALAWGIPTFLQTQHMRFVLTNLLMDYSKSSSILAHKQSNKVSVTN